MAKTYNEWLSIADDHKARLDYALSHNNAKDILYYRGKYIYDLKQAYKLNNRGTIPAGICGKRTTTNLLSEIQYELRQHQVHIDNRLQENKQNSNINNHTLSSELGLKIRRLATRASQVDFATGSATKSDIAKDALSLAGTTIKAPVMVSAKVVSKIGPLAITICALPVTLLASLLSFVVDVGRDKPHYEGYNNTVVHQFSDTLKDAVRSLSTSMYNGLGRI